MAPTMWGLLLAALCLPGEADDRWREFIDHAPEPLRDCDGDGIEECGLYSQWQSPASSQGGCARASTCEWKYELFASRSTRAKEAPVGTCGCSASCPPNTADVNATKVFNFGKWHDWGRHQMTCAPWMMPSSDDELRTLLTYAAQKGYKVRPSGAAHSAGGLVVAANDGGVIVVSLSRYIAPDGWEFRFKPSPDGGTPRVVINAGWTQLQVMQRLRPLDFFLPAQTAGYFFQLGGIISNSVHGGMYDKGFLFEYITSLRVMLHNGTIAVFDQEEDLRYWRNSYGLLGIILSIEFQVVHRTKLQMFPVKQRRLAAWNETEFWKYINVDAEANLPETAVGRPVPTGSRRALSGEFFLHMGPLQTAMVGVSKHADENATVPGVPDSAPENVEENYAKLSERLVVDANKGFTKYGTSSRDSGSPPIQIVIEDGNIRFGPGGIPLPLNELLEWIGRQDLMDKTISQNLFAEIFSLFTLFQVPLMIEYLRDKVNDGFWLTQAPPALISAWFLPVDKAFEAMDFLRSEHLKSFDPPVQGNAEKGPYGKFVWNQPGEFRFLKVGDTAELQVIPPGQYFNSEFLSFSELTSDPQEWKKAFKVVQDHWVTKLGARPHMGKLWGFEEGPDGKVEPFGDKFACSIYSDATKARFEAYRKKMDPEGRFADGLGMKLLAPCPQELREEVLHV